jgi:hypothetical protein
MQRLSRGAEHQCDLDRTENKKTGSRPVFFIHIPGKNKLS